VFYQLAALGFSRGGFFLFTTFMKQALTTRTSFGFDGILLVEIRKDVLCGSGQVRPPPPKSGAFLVMPLLIAWAAPDPLLAGVANDVGNLVAGNDVDPHDVAVGHACEPIDIDCIPDQAQVMPVEVCGCRLLIEGRADMSVTAPALEARAVEALADVRDLLGDGSLSLGVRAGSRHDGNERQGKALADAAVNQIQYIGPFLPRQAFRRFPAAPTRLLASV
jgi:hypothetical protein